MSITREEWDAVLAKVGLLRKQPRVGVSLIVTNDDGHVLMGRRKGSHGAGSWSFPGGHLEHGEGIHECAIREMEEETGVTPYYVAETGQVTNDIFEREGLHYITIFVLASIRAERTPRVMEPEKCEEWKWVPWDDMPRDLFLPIRNLRATGYRPPL